ncbi:MAG TPA: site-specific integrase [Bdellovibrio sp.]|nr:site-specific integrase [Bdellovibrio sp.]
MLIEKSFEEQSTTIKYGIVLNMYNESLIARDLSKLTIDNYMSCLKLHTNMWNNLPIEGITTEEIRQLIRVKLANLAVSQQKNILKYIRGIFNFAVEAGFLMRNPVPRMTFKTAVKIKKVLSQQQAKIFLEKAQEYDHEWYPIWATALYTGMRNGELHNLTWDKIDLENRTILVSSTWNKKDGVKELTKSGVDRIIDMAPSLVTLFKELKLKGDGNPFVLPRRQDWDTGRQAEVLRMFLESIGLPRIRFHDLRASWATMLLNMGIEPAKVMKLGGWKDLKTMMIYLRKAGIDTRGTLNDFNIHDVSRKTGSVLEFKSPGL